MESIVEMGKISSRGQIAIPADIRNQLGLDEGSKVVFRTENGTLLIRKVTEQTWGEITRPLRACRKLN